MKEFAIVIGMFLLWIVLNRWVLPWFGISTCCMSGGCARDNSPPFATRLTNDQDKDVVEPRGDQP
jgi:hypothetical protein